MSNLDDAIAKEKAKHDAKMRRLKAAKRKRDERARALALKILEQQQPEMFKQLVRQAERDLERQAQARANAKRDAKSQLSQPENGEHSEQNQPQPGA